VAEQQRYPVVLTGTTKYVAWVEADSAAEAHKIAYDDPTEHLDRGQPPVDASLDSEQDPYETAEFIWLYGHQFMPQHDAHVHTHRWATRDQNGAR
jgi:hypothetical protein